MHAIPRRAGALLLGLALLACAGVAAAQTWPAHSVRIVVPFPAGGGVDVWIRAVAVELSARWAQPVVVENRGGAGSIVGAEAVARAAPDGYTLMATVNQTVVANRYLYKTLPYDPEKSFAPISLMVQSDQLLVAHPSVAAKDLRELVALARKRPGQLNYGSYGRGSQPQLAYEMLKKREGIDLVHIPYNGIAPLLTAITAGDVQLATGSPAVAGALLRAGRLKALAIAGPNRSPQFPDVPTTGELGYPYLLTAIWFGLFAPAGTPPAIIDKIYLDTAAIARAPAFAEARASARGLTVVAGSPRELAATIREESVLTTEMVRAAGVEPE
jgi:tripartite-type tricarboxylate transporter receptor subunit TctC